LALTLTGANYVIFSQRFTADPAPIVHNGRVYLYTSHDKKAAHGFNMIDYNCLSSADMVNWRDEGIVFSLENSTNFPGCSAWAQQVVELKNGTFVMVFPAMNCPNKSDGGIGVASASHPAGPFVEARTGKLPGFPDMQPGSATQPQIQVDDPTIFIDDTGGAYVCANVYETNKSNLAKQFPWGPSCGELNEDLISWKTPPAFPSSYNQSTWHFFEAPWLMRHTIGNKDKYIMSYMMKYDDCPGNNWTRVPNDQCAWSHGGFDIGYAIADVSTAGPLLSKYKPQGNSLMWANDFTQNEGKHPWAGGNNHQGIVEFPVGSSELYLFYHSAWLSGSGIKRNVGVDRLYVNETSQQTPLLPVTATPSWLRSSSPLSPYSSQVPAFTMAQASDNIFTSLSNDAGSAIGGGAKQLCLDGIMDGAWTLTRQLDFGQEPAASQQDAVALTLRVKVPPCSAGDCPRLTVHLDGLEADAVAYCQLNTTNAQWETVQCAVKPAGLHGIHDLWMLWEGAECLTSLLQVAWWRLTAPSGGEVAVRPSLPKPHTVVQLEMIAAAAHSPVGVIALGTKGSVLAAKRGIAAAKLALHDNEDGTWGIQIGLNKPARYACAGYPLDANGNALLAASANSPDEPCARFRVQVMKYGQYAIRSVAIGLWVRWSGVGDGVGQSVGSLVVASANPRNDSAALFNFSTTSHQLPPRGAYARRAHA
jgi:arabinoxylan arabinofuranohydrolase